MINMLLLGLVGMIYIVVAIVYLVDGKTGLAITFFAHALANYGLYLMGR